MTDLLAQERVGCRSAPGVAYRVTEPARLTLRWRERSSVFHMPRPGPRRQSVTLRLNPGGLATVEALATAAGVCRSEMIRVLLGEAIQARGARKPGART